MTNVFSLKTKKPLSVKFYDYFWPWLVGLIVRLISPWLSHGFRYMDEHWQVIEPAYFLLHKKWSITQEWVEGSRSWFYPGLVASIMKTAESLGLQDPISINAFIRSVHGAISSLAIIIVFQVVFKLSRYQPRLLAIASAWFIALWPFAVYCSTHTHGEMLAALFVLIALSAVLFFKNQFYLYTFAGFSLGVAALLKIDVAIAGLGLAAWLILQRQFKNLGYLILGSLPTIIFLGLLDKLSWGSWFHSVIAHGQANLVHSIGNQWGTSPWYYHFIYFFDLAGALTFASSFFIIFYWRQFSEPLKSLWFQCLFFVVCYSFIAHKEKRFMAPLLYIAIELGFITFSYALVDLNKNQMKKICYFCALLVGVHAGANIQSYFIHQAWFDRIQAISMAEKIPNIEKILVPQWPIEFFFSRKVLTENTSTDWIKIKTSLHKINKFSLACDWDDFSKIEQLGYRCTITFIANRQAYNNGKKDIPKTVYCEKN